MGSVTIVLNGTSSSGKTTLAQALRERWPTSLQVTGLDIFIATLDLRMIALPGAGAPSEGFTWVDEVDGDVACTRVVPGPLARALVHAAHEFWAASARCGLDQVVDYVALDDELATDLRARLAPFDVLYVGVHCPVEVIEQRECARGDRPLGQGRGIGLRVHQGLAYDLVVDTGVATPEECAEEILRLVGDRFARPTTPAVDGE